MMDETTTRRGFLKGLGAAVALLTVAPALVTAEVVAAPPSIDPIAPVVDAGELWLKIANRWRLVGGLRSLSTHQEVIEIPSIDSPYVGFARAYPPELRAEIAADPSGADLVRDAGFSGNRVDILVGFNDYEIEVTDTRLLNFVFEVGQPDRVLSDEEYQWQRRLKRGPLTLDFLNVSIRADARKMVMRCR